MRHKRSRFGILCFVVVFVASTAAVFAGTPPYETEQELGHALYFDKDLSLNRNQACASCHLPSAGFDDPDSNLPVSRGSIPTKFGTRNAPSSAYLSNYLERNNCRSRIFAPYITCREWVRGRLKLLGESGCKLWACE